jgi:DNA-binding Xre family transcriptional regulator
MIGIDAQRLAAAIIESGMGEVEICARAGVAHQTFSKMLKGQMVRFPSVGRICKILELKPVEIIREVADETLQAKGEPELVPSPRRPADKPKNHPQGARLATLGRAPG